MAELRLSNKVIFGCYVPFFELLLCIFWLENINVHVVDEDWVTNREDGQDHPAVDWWAS